MKPRSLLLRVYGEYRDGQWSIICLDFNLAAQADTLDAADSLLKDQIVSYLDDALVGADAKHAGYFLTRRAPFKYFVKYYLHRLRRCLDGKFTTKEVAQREAVPMRVARA